MNLRRRLAKSAVLRLRTSKAKGNLPMTGKYMAYVGSYSYTGKAKGITVYDVDVEAGKFIYRCEVEVDNSSYLKASQNGQILYSIADEGVVAFRVLPNGSLARLNSAITKSICNSASPPLTVIPPFFFQ